MYVQFLDEKLEKFVVALEKPTIAKILRMIGLLKQFGNGLGMPHSKKVGDRLFELRIRGQQEVRIFYTFHKNTAILLHGFVKKSEQIPPKELTVAYQKLYTLDKI